MAREPEDRQPVLLSDFKEGHTIPDFVAWAFDGCFKRYGYNLEKLAWRDQKGIISVALNAEPLDEPDQDKRAEVVKHAAAKALWQLFEKQGRLHELGL